MAANTRKFWWAFGLALAIILAAAGGIELILHMRPAVHDVVRPDDWSQPTIEQSMRAGDGIRLALEAYRSRHGHYPETLTEAYIRPDLMPRPTAGCDEWTYLPSGDRTFFALAFDNADRTKSLVTHSTQTEWIFCDLSRRSD